MSEERDLLVFTDDSGQEIEMEVVDYFTYGDEEFALLTDANDPEPENTDGERDVYIMKVVGDGENEEFLPVEEDRMDELIDALQNMYDEEEEDGEDGEEDWEEYDDVEYDDTDDSDIGEGSDDTEK
ncbi:DUF1292 domain-containing protein [Eubacteriales bacterium mix99]|jgi:pyruvate/2-oxoacid:ferredoxin oxidoreductase alpha subunit